MEQRVTRRRVDLERRRICQALHPARTQRRYEQAEARDTRDREAELQRLSTKLSTLQKAQAVRSGDARPEPFALEEARLPKSCGELNELAWSLVDPDRTVFGRETEGLALARRAVSLAPATGDARASALDTLVRRLIVMWSPIPPNPAVT